uniref:Putative secreted protein n=1 Tax=Ixodes ricinus TaxID=34613 RepID=A0A6B0U0E6_IXORI
MLPVVVFLRKFCTNRINADLVVSTWSAIRHRIFETTCILCIVYATAHETFSSVRNVICIAHRTFENSSWMSSRTVLFCFEICCW